MTTSPAVDNNVNTEALLQARDALKEAPEAAEFVWKVTSEWEDGTYSRQTIEHFSGLGGPQQHKQAFTLEGDHPEVFASEDRGPTPVETVLAGLAGCLTAGVAAVAQNRGIQLRSVRATVEGNHNVLGILGGDPEVRNGFNDVSVHFDIDADASEEDIAALVAQSQKRSAVFDALANPTNINVSVG
ncbi:OsmC family protein [Actinomycetospora sp. TBRC 11914]|uniref:OsmC family protein n=1 Tax=Actinomycetospora sp. TBRC 11914 TaxID=2729387 RepID=UPI00145C78B3|nr:OsmC family protein [Actinomycetospora sp. TBRC 11914]NMO91508.1 OsmC family protein [Actinomycetospora sp. TBRC 11914]